MYLKRLDMYGFKSFKDKLSITFDSNITAIVGPNGSGKSNITDAIRWVLGEQSVKSLRGSRMEDVIFAGTTNHKALGLAEVSLTLDNSTGLFPGDYAEICVTRRVYRSGESEYFINKTPCRLKDIHELFMDTGLGRDGYSIISQGKIDSILSAKAEDRRQIFEEAAGISKYKYRKTEASRKLAATEENLIRIRDIADELSARLTPLAAQAEKARAYVEMYETLKNLEINLSVIDIEKLRAIKDKTEVLFQQISDEADANRAALHSMQAEEETLYAEVKNRDIEIENTRMLLHGTELSIKEWEGDNALLLQRIENCKENSVRLTAEIETAQSEITRLLSEKEKAVEDVASCLSTQNEAEAKLLKERQVLETMSDEISAQNQLTEDLSATAATLLLQIEDTKRRREMLYAEDLKARLEELSAEYKQCEMRCHENEVLRQETIEKQVQIADVIAQKESDFKALCAEKPTIEAYLASRKEAYNENMRKLHIAYSRKKALSDMEQNMEGYQKGVKAVMNANLPADIRGVLSQLIHAEPPYVTAIETALGGASQNIVVASEAHAGRATFLPISAVRGKRLDAESRLRSMPGYIGLACDLVSYDSAYEGIVLQLLGGVAVMDTMDHAISAARKFSHQFKIVTTDGELFMRGGSVSGGSRATGTQLLGRSGEIARLQKECQLLQKELDNMESEIENAEEKLSDTREAIQAMRAEAAQIQSEKAQLAGTLQLCDSIEKTEKQHLTRLTADMESVTARMENRDVACARLEEEEKELSDRHADAVARTEASRGVLLSKMRARDAQNDALTALRIAVGNAEKDTDTIKTQILLYESEIEKIKAQISEREEEKKKVLEDSVALQLRFENKLLDMEAAKKQMQTLADSIEKTAEKKGGATARTEILRADIQKQNERLQSLEGEKARLEARLEKVQTDLDSTINHLWDAYSLTYSAATEYRSDIGAEESARKNAAELRRKIRALGSVNVDAIEEYTAVQTRFSTITAQIRDLESAKDSLEKIIRDMTRVMTETFASQFSAIAENFKETFRALFGGGTAKLSLTEPDKVLDSGIEIDVQPPGKKLQNLTLLSGGEKALSAIAILFAVMHVRPAPFCILDEIESALDDGNIARFASYLRDYKNTQFIIVTHRRGTMEAADILYGVTMQEKGVSKILTMHLTDASEKEEATS